ncbi:MAG: dockerin type I repeat-containing protein [Porcipelethomonas sp.]
MKLRKFISVIASMAILSSLPVCGGFSVSAEQPETRAYSLSELMEMTDEEFLSLGTPEWTYSYYKFMNAEYLYNTLSGYEGRFNMPNGGLIEFKYQANLTEDKIAALLGDTVKYSVTSPIYPPDSEGPYFDENGYRLNSTLTYYFPDYTNLTDENHMDVAKIYYCLSQVMIFYRTLTSGSDVDYTVQGDVNVDMTLDVFDAIYIAKDSVGQIRFTDLQKKIGDMNNDGNTDVFDAIAIAKDTVK